MWLSVGMLLARESGELSFNVAVSWHASSQRVWRDYPSMWLSVGMLLARESGEIIIQCLSVGMLLARESGELSFFNVAVSWHASSRTVWID